jgi:hypothetical protein
MPQGNEISLGHFFVRKIPNIKSPVLKRSLDASDLINAMVGTGLAAAPNVAAE